MIGARLPIGFGLKLTQFRPGQDLPSGLKDDSERSVARLGRFSDYTARTGVWRAVPSICPRSDHRPTLVIRRIH